jgi:TM2 domain-containing membrane protein YozV/predicted RNA-binding Zn-ribbon protein involved in translation (DUF1610 family)
LSAIIKLNGKNMQKYCQNCGKLLPDEPASFCPNCGAAANRQEYKENKENKGKDGEFGEFDKFVSNKDPFIASILSLLFPGLGQVYNGEFNKGLMIQIVFIMSIFGGSMFFLLFLVPLAVWVLSIYDAYNEADKMRKGQTELKNPTLRETLIFLLWPFVLAAILTVLVILLSIFIVLIVLIAVLVFTLPFVALAI